MLLAGAAIGPVVGGVMLEYFWWGSVFLLAVPVMVLLLVLGPLLLPEYRNRDAGRLDLVSVALSLATLLPAIYGLKELAEARLGSRPDWPRWSSACVFGVLFVRRQRTLSDPLLDLRLFRDKRSAPRWSACCSGSRCSAR